MALANRYCAAMLFEKIRRIPALLMALILAVGLVTLGFAGPDIIVKSAVTAVNDMPVSSDMPMPGNCNGCAGDEKGVAPTACSTLCSPVIAAPLVAVVLYAAPAETLIPTAGSEAVGRIDPPDPYPPRPISMS